MKLARQIAPVISLVDAAARFDVRSLVAPLQKYVDRFVGPAWGVGCKLLQRLTIKKGTWGLVFLDTADVEGALGYHDLTDDGLPLAKVFVDTTVDYGEQVSVTASHELAEMLVDPAIQLGAWDNKETWWAYEVCDAVQADVFKVGGQWMSDFVLPAWFESFRRPGSTAFDHLGKVTRPFQIAPRGYMPVYRVGEWQQLFGRGGRAAYRARPHPRGGARTKPQAETKP